MNKWKMALELTLGKRTENVPLDFSQKSRYKNYFVLEDHKGRQYEVGGDTENDAYISVCTRHGVHPSKLTVKSSRPA